ncbi:MAG: N-methyl-L-tryptophan oxidase [Planctomycetes bacterium]|nr:N-methyl-L-tryptophan oxidase [Planctomycetota bacterium]
MIETYDVIVLGVGGFGSSAMYHLARQNCRVLGIDRFHIAHDRGSSHGETRIIRKAYFEHPDYVPLLQRAYVLWDDLQRECGQTLLHKVGLFIAGKADCDSVSGTLKAARLHHLPVDQLDVGEARRRFPGYAFPEDWAVVFEADAGYLNVENCVTAHVAAACRRGANVRTGETVLAWESDGHSVVVRTDRGVYSAGRLVITPGAWAQPILNLPKAANGRPGWWDHLKVLRKVLCWFPADPVYDVDRGNSTFFFETPVGQFYGFPRLDGQTVKMAEHTGGLTVTDPLAVDRDLQPSDLPRLVEFAREFMPRLGIQPLRHAVCLYTMTPDGHFCIGRHPEWSNVAIGAGFSGHGFKFTGVLGEVLSDLVLTGQAAVPVDFLTPRKWP